MMNIQPVAQSMSYFQTMGSVTNPGMQPQQPMGMQNNVMPTYGQNPYAMGGNGDSGASQMMMLLMSTMMMMLLSVLGKDKSSKTPDIDTKKPTAEKTAPETEEPPPKKPDSPKETAPKESPPANSGGSTLSSTAPAPLLRFKKEIEAASSKTGMSANMLAAMIWQESRGNLEAVSINGGNGGTDSGLMQINPNTYGELQKDYPELAGKNVNDAGTNILAGAYYLKDQKKKFGSDELALRAYNSGPNGVDKNNPNATPAGTGDPTYVTKILDFIKKLETGGTLPP